MRIMRHSPVTAGLLLMALVVAGCGLLGPGPTDWTRRDMPTDGLLWAVTYQLQGPANSSQQLNQIELRGMNTNAPTLDQQTTFSQMSGAKTQDVQVTLPSGQVDQALGMVKVQRFAGLSKFMSVESATYSAVDATGKAVCGAKVRLDFNRNLTQYTDPNKRDFDSLWYYDIPCYKDGNSFSLDFEHASMRAIVLDEVWQARIAAGSFFFNWGHSVTIEGGPMAAMPAGWWEHWDVSDTTNDSVGAAQLMADAVKDLESSSQKWLEFSTAEFSNAYLIYSAGDADQYATFDRILLNRQDSYAVFYRPDRATAWDYVTVKPIYNYEWNDVDQVLSALKGWGSDPFKDKLDDSGMPKDPQDQVVKELERVGWMNGPNTSLEQIQFLDKNNQPLYTMTIRAFVGAADTLIMFGKAAPPKLADVQAQAGPGVADPMPQLYDDNGNPAQTQDWTPSQWAEWQRESTMWNFMKDNPKAVGAELEVQYRFADSSTWTPVTCANSNGSTYTCGYNPDTWNLSASYMFNNDNVRAPWMIMQLLGEVGVRTLGLSYASGLYAGTGLLFGMAQKVHYDEFFSGYSPESIFRFDSRAETLPDTLKEAWADLHS